MKRTFSGQDMRPLVPVTSAAFVQGVISLFRAAEFGERDEPKINAISCHGLIADAWQQKDAARSHQRRLMEGLWSRHRLYCRIKR